MHLSFYHKVHKEINKGHKAHFVFLVVIFVKPLLIKQTLNNIIKHINLLHCIIVAFTSTHISYSQIDS